MTKEVCFVSVGTPNLGLYSKLHVQIVECEPSWVSAYLTQNNNKILAPPSRNINYLLHNTFHINKKKLIFFYTKHTLSRGSAAKYFHSPTLSSFLLNLYNFKGIFWL